jgi:hypothetical protein
MVLGTVRDFAPLRVSGARATRALSGISFADRFSVPTDAGHSSANDMTNSQEPSPPDEGMPFGIEGVALRPGDHIGCFYRGEDARDAVLLPYLRTGMQAGDPCLCFIDTTAPEELRQRVVAETDDVSVTGDLDVQAACDAYLGGGTFSMHHMIGLLESRVSTALDERATGAVARVTGEMCWVLRSAGAADELFAYEHAVNDFAPRHRQVLLCLYDIAQFSAEALINAVRAHPKVLVAGLLADNPWHEAQRPG